MDIIHVNHELMIIYTPRGTHHRQDQIDFNNLILQAKKEISSRPYILDRFEHWEITGEFNKSVRLLLMGRSRNDEDKKLVKRYLKTLEMNHDN